MITPTVWRVTTTVLSGVAQILTALRVFYHARKRCLWADDVLAAIAAAFTLSGLVAFWIYTDVEGVGPFVQSQTNRIRAYWVIISMFIAVVWTTRVSSVFSMIRIIPHRLRTIPYLIAALFCMMGAALFVQKILLCHQNPDWETSSDLQCLGKTTLITELCFESVSNIIMVLAPLRALSMFKTSPFRRRDMMFILFVGVLISAGSIGHAVFLVLNIRPLEGFTSNIQAATSLLLVNLPPLGAWMCLIHNPELEDPDDLSKSRIGRSKSKLPPDFKRKISSPKPLSPRIARSHSASTRGSSSFFPEEKIVLPSELRSCVLGYDLGSPSTIASSLSAYSSDQKLGEIISTSPDAGNTRFNTDYRQSATSAVTDSLSLSAYPILSEPPTTVQRPTSQNNPDEYPFKNVRFLSPVVTESYSLHSRQSDSTYSSIYTSYFTGAGAHGCDGSETEPSEYPLPSHVLTAMLSLTPQPGPRPASRSPEPF